MTEIDVAACELLAWSRRLRREAEEILEAHVDPGGSVQQSSPKRKAILDDRVSDKLRVSPQGTVDEGA
jgi:hypothetical protein